MSIFAEIDDRLSFKERYRQKQETYQHETLTGVFVAQFYTRLTVFIFIDEIL